MLVRDENFRTNTYKVDTNSEYSQGYMVDITMGSDNYSAYFYKTGSLKKILIKIVDSENVGIKAFVDDINAMMNNEDTVRRFITDLESDEITDDDIDFGGFDEEFGDDDFGEELLLEDELSSDF